MVTAEVLDYKKRQKEWIDEIVRTGWFVWEDDEIYFLKHFYKDEDKRILYQIISAPHIGTGVYTMKTSLNSIKISKLLFKNNVLFKMDFYDFDGLTLDSETALMEEEIGKEKFLKQILQLGYITEDELIYFTESELKRKKLSQTLPSIILKVV